MMNNSCEYINPISNILEDFLLERDWKEDVRNILVESKNNDICYEVETLINTLNNLNYPQIIRSVKDLIALKKIRRSTINKIYDTKTNNCLLIFGNIGSGKSLLCQKSTIEKIIPKNIHYNIYDVNKRLKLDNGNLDKTVNNTTISLFKKIIDGDFSVLPDQNPTIFLIDNYTEVLNKLNISISMLHDTILTSTRYHKIKWIITTNDLASVIYNPIFTKLAHHQFSNYENITPVPRKISGWLDLDYQNSIKKVPEEILNNYELRVYDIKMQDVNHLPPAIVDLIIKSDDNSSSKMMDLIVHYSLDNLRCSSNNKIKIIEAIKSIRTVEMDDDQVYFKVGDRNELFIDSSTTQCELLIDNGLLSSSSVDNDRKLILSHPFLWAYYTSFKIINIRKSALVSAYNKLDIRKNSFGIYLKMILQYQYFRNDDNFDIKDIINHFGNIDGLLYFLSMSDDCSKLKLIKNLSKLSKTDRDFNKLKKIKNYLPSLSLYTYSIAKCSYVIEKNGFDKTQCIYLVRASSIAFKLLNNSNDAHMLAEIFVSLFRELSNRDQKLKALPIIYEMAAMMSCSKGRTTRAQDKFLSIVTNSFFEFICTKYTDFLNLATDKKFKIKSINGRHIFCDKLFESAFRKFISSSYIELDNANIICHIATTLINNKVYNHGITSHSTDKKKLYGYYEFLLASKFHRAVGTRIRVLVVRDTAPNYVSKVIFIKISTLFHKHISLAMETELSQGLIDGLLYIARHIDLARSDKVARLPSYLKEVVNSSLNEELVSKNIQYESTEKFTLRTENLIHHLKK